MNSYFMSFSTREGNLGVVVTDADNELGALANVNRLGINPGGEVAIWQTYKEEANRLGRDRLISSATMRSMGYVSQRDVTPIEQDYRMEMATRICQGCNEA